MISSLYPLHAKDVMQLLDCSIATAYRKLKKIKGEKQKKKHAIITYEEFCRFYQINK